MKFTQLSITALLVATALSKVVKKHSVMRNVMPEQTGRGQRKTWTSLTIDPEKITKLGKVLYFASLNAELVTKVLDQGDGKTSEKGCYLKALVNNTMYGSRIFGLEKNLCANSSATKINKEGSVLFVNGDLSYFYINRQGDISYTGYSVYVGIYYPGIAQGVEYGMTKSTDGLGHDYFRIFSRASDVNGNYPEDFYVLVSNATNGGFVDGNYSSLSVKRLGWKFKQTSNDVKFNKIDQVNFVTNHDESFLLEGQWITGKGTTTTAEVLSQTASKPACQYGAVNTKSFSAGPKGNDTMYGRLGTLHFSCGNSAGLRTYQGVVTYNTTNKYYYSINPDTGKIQVCWKIPGLFEETTSITEFTRDCSLTLNTALKLQTNEYYSIVGVLNTGRSNLTVVNIKSKADIYAMRQVIIDFSGTSNLPTLDTETFFYSVSYDTIYRIKKTIPKGQSITGAFYKVANTDDNKDSVLEISNKQPVCKSDRNLSFKKKEDVKEAVIF